MVFVDYAIIIAYFVFSLAIAIFYSKRANKSSEEFFLSGRNLPWYLAGLSMVATTFAADTPLAVTEMVAKNGISGNWIWWNFAFGGILTVFFFARLWRRAGIMTEAEFAELRYSGRAAKFLRGFKATYLGLFMNVIIIGWVNSAMIAILTVMFDIPESTVIFYVFGCMAVVALYSAISGLWGVVVTDAFQFIIAMVGCIVLAFIVVNSPQVGGIAGLKAHLGPQALSFFPTITNSGSNLPGMLTMTVAAFLAFVGVQWWASWYPGAEPGGGGYVAQRMMSAKDERHSLFATLFFQTMHYAIRPWPWILVGLATIKLYPELASNPKLGYIKAMNDFLPMGLKGLLVAAFFAAYMSTISTQLNWGTSYLINDLYRRFIKPSESEKHYLGASKVTTVLLMLISIVVTLFITRITAAWEFIIECGAGLGLVLILRWFWWRINVWSEISATIAPFVVFGVIKVFNYLYPAKSIAFPETLFIISGVTTIVWLIVTYLTPPEKEEVLKNFYRRVHPGGILWKKISDTLPNTKGDTGFLFMFLCWGAGVMLVYSLLFGIGYLIFGEYISATISLFLSAIAIFAIYTFFNKFDPKNII